MNFQNSEFQISLTHPKLQRDIMKVSQHQLGTKFRSKHDIYIYMTEIRNKLIVYFQLLKVHKYLPPKNSINKEFIKQILKKEKEVFDMSEIKQIKVPKYYELSIKNLYSSIIEDEKIRKYLPDSKNFSLISQNTIYPEFVSKIIEHAQNLRYSPEENEERKEFILISDEWYEQLMSHPFVSKKPGKTLQLLKESTKFYKGRKATPKKELGISLKRFKGQNSIIESQSERQDDNDLTIQRNSIFSETQTVEDFTPKRSKFNI